MIDFTMVNTAADLERLLDEVEALLEERDQPPKRQYAVRLALEELVSNVINYAYTDKEEHRILISLDADGSPFSVTIKDDGQPFNPLTDARAPVLEGPVEDRPIGGLGLHILQKMGLKLDYRREDGLNRLRVDFPEN